LKAPRAGYRGESFNAYFPAYNKSIRHAVDLLESITDNKRYRKSEYNKSGSTGRKIFLHIFLSAYK
jgi:hypothetical protein